MKVTIFNSMYIYKFAYITRVIFSLATGNKLGTRDFDFQGKKDLMMALYFITAISLAILDFKLGFLNIATTASQID